MSWLEANALYQPDLHPELQYHPLYGNCTLPMILNNILEALSKMLHRMKHDLEVLLDLLLKYSIQEPESVQKVRKGLYCCFGICCTLYNLHEDNNGRNNMAHDGG